MSKPKDKPQDWPERTKYDLLPTKGKGSLTPTDYKNLVEAFRKFALGAAKDKHYEFDARFNYKSKDNSYPKKGDTNVEAREEVLKGWMNIFFGSYKTASEKAHAGIGKKPVILRTEIWDPAAATRGQSIMLWTTELLMDMSLKDNFTQYPDDGDHPEGCHLGHPVNSGGAILHEFTHLVYNATHTLSTKTVSEVVDASVGGTEEGFCDYFALNLVGGLCTEVHGLFEGTIGAPVIYYTRELYKEITKAKCTDEKFMYGSEVNGNNAHDDRNLYARRDYSILLKAQGDWKKDRHFYGKQMGWVFRRLRTVFAAKKAEYAEAFDDLLWDYFFANAEWNQAHEEMFKIAEFLAKKQAGTFLKDFDLKAELLKAVGSKGEFKTFGFGKTAVPGLEAAKWAKDIGVLFS